MTDLNLKETLIDSCDTIIYVCSSLDEMNSLRESIKIGQNKYHFDFHRFHYIRKYSSKCINVTFIKKEKQQQQRRRQQQQQPSRNVTDSLNITVETGLLANMSTSTAANTSSNNNATDNNNTSSTNSNQAPQAISTGATTMTNEINSTFQQQQQQQQQQIIESDICLLRLPEENKKFIGQILDLFTYRFTRSAYTPRRNSIRSHLNIFSVIVVSKKIHLLLNMKLRNKISDTLLGEYQRPIEYVKQPIKFREIIFEDSNINL